MPNAKGSPSYVDALGRIYQARKGLGSTFFTLRDGHRVKSPALPVRDSLEEAITDLERYATTKNLNPLAGQILGGGGSR